MLIQKQITTLADHLRCKESVWFGCVCFLMFFVVDVGVILVKSLVDFGIECLYFDSSLFYYWSFELNYVHNAIIN